MQLTDDELKQFEKLKRWNRGLLITSIVMVCIVVLSYFFVNGEMVLRFIGFPEEGHAMLLKKWEALPVQTPLEKYLQENLIGLAESLHVAIKSIVWAVVFTSLFWLLLMNVSFVAYSFRISKVLNLTNRLFKKNNENN